MPNISVHPATVAIERRNSSHAVSAGDTLIVQVYWRGGNIFTVVNAFQVARTDHQI